MKKNLDENIDFGFLTFDENNLDDIVSLIGLKFNKKEYLTNNNRKGVKCNCCGYPIKRKNLGNILPGSNIIYCDNPTCFAEYMDKYLHL
jgi:hypothetical protein